MRGHFQGNLLVHLQGVKVNVLWMSTAITQPPVSRFCSNFVEMILTARSLVPQVFIKIHQPGDPLVIFS